MRNAAKLLMTIIPMAAVLISFPSHAANFGDEVAACAAKYELPLDSPELAKVFAACEQHVSEIRAETDKAVSIVLMRECLEKATRRLDDRISPASDISRAVAFQCRDQWKNLMLASGASGSGASAYPSQPLSDTALTFVLEGRSRQRDKKP